MRVSHREIVKFWDETHPFIVDAEKCLSNDEREEFIEYIARSPTAGVVISGTGGIRKARKTDLSPAEKAAMRRIVAEIIASYLPK